MKKVLVALGLLALVGTSAWAQGSTGTWGQGPPAGSSSSPQHAIKVMVVGGVNATDTTYVPLQFDGSGNLLGSEASKDRDHYFRHASIINDTTAVGMADSSAYYDTHSASRMWLRVQVAPAAGAAPPVVRLAIRVHASYTSPALNDTNEVAPWSVIRAAGLDIATGLDTLSYVRNVAPSSVAKSDFEFVVEFREMVAGKWGEETVQWVPLCDNRGVFYWAPYTAITSRVLGGTGVTRQRIDLVGTAVR